MEVALAGSVPGLHLAPVSAAHIDPCRTGALDHAPGQMVRSNLTF